jgi:hypothetical protein
MTIRAISILKTGMCSIVTAYWLLLVSPETAIHYIDHDTYLIFIPRYIDFLISILIAGN